MRGNDLLDKMELVDPAFVEVADSMPEHKKFTLRKWNTMAACLCLVSVVAIFLHFGWKQFDPRPGEIVLSEKTTAKVSYGGGPAVWHKGSLVGMTEEELFARKNMYVFWGKVSGLTDITIDFNGEKEYRCIATIVIDKIYQGDINAGEEITMLLPCAIGGVHVEDTGVITQLKSGMEGVFMPWVYDENSYMEMNGAVLMMRDLADCGLADGMRWAFLATERGLVFERNAYPGAKNATELEEIETYVLEMLN